MRKRLFDIVLLLLVLPCLWWFFSPWFVQFSLLAELGRGHWSVKATVVSFLVLGRLVYLLLMPSAVAWLAAGFIWDKIAGKRGTLFRRETSSRAN